jgi:hypothetical protein
VWGRRFGAEQILEHAADGGVDVEFPHIDVHRAHGRNIPVGGDGHVHDFGAARFLRVPDLCIRRELEVADDHLVALAGEIERACERIEAGRDRCSHGNLVRMRAQKLRGELAHGLVLGDPHVPVRADEQAVFHVLLECRLHIVRQGAIGAAVEIGLAAEHGELASQAFEIRFYSHVGLHGGLQ